MNIVVAVVAFFDFSAALVVHNFEKAPFKITGYLLMRSPH